MSWGSLGVEVATRAAFYKRSSEDMTRSERDRLYAAGKADAYAWVLETMTTDSNSQQQEER